MIDIDELLNDVKIKVNELKESKNPLGFSLEYRLYHIDYIISRKDNYNKIIALTYNSTSFLKKKINTHELDNIEKLCKCANVSIAPLPAFQLIRTDKTDMSVYSKNYAVEPYNINKLYKLINNNLDDMFYIFKVKNNLCYYVSVKDEAKERIPICYWRKEKLKILGKL